MKSIAIALMLGVPAVDAAPATKFSRRVVPHILIDELRVAGFNIGRGNGSISCVENADAPWDCEILWGSGGETKDPAPVINAHRYRDLRAESQAAWARIRVLAEKWRRETITAAEKDELVKLFILTSVGT